MENDVEKAVMHTAKSFRQAFFKRLAVSKGGAFGRRRHAQAHFGVNFQNSPVDCFEKRGILAENAPKLPTASGFLVVKQR